jgi:hypothetical protein
MCGWYHWNCGDEPFAARDLMAVLAVGDAAAVGRFLKSIGKGGAAVSYNSDRMAIQMVDCQKRVVVHVPVSTHDGIVLASAMSATITMAAGHIGQ